jgi:hypothetical protein
MSRRTRWILLVLIVALVGGAVALVVVERPKLDDARSAVDARWKPLRAPDQLALRYQRLGEALDAFDAAGGAGRGVSKDLHAALTSWDRALRDGNDETQVEAANLLEGQGTRLIANALGSERLKAIDAVTSSLTAFTAARPSPALVSAYNEAVDRYESERTGALQQPVARLLAYDTRPALVLDAGF